MNPYEAEDLSNLTVDAGLFCDMLFVFSMNGQPLKRQKQIIPYNDGAVPSVVDFTIEYM